MASHFPPPTGSSFGMPGEDAAYDYVVIGGGTAGLPLATRLAQDGRYSVAVIEAGGFYDVDNGDRSVIPAFCFHSAGWTMDGVNPSIDWEFVTEPVSGVNDKSIHIARGKCLGGSSARNYLVYNRPSAGTMQEWADRVGDSSWEWEKVLPFYKNSSTITPADMSLRSKEQEPMLDPAAFGNGPVQVSYSQYAGPVAPSFSRAFEEMGLPRREKGMQSGELLGHGYLPATLHPKTQERCSSYSSYGRLALDSTQLKVYTRTFAKQILFKDKVTTGVKVETEGRPFVISAGKEVIISAGAFQSPQLLMVSGIGPAETLRKFNIPVIHELKGVGQGMQDNPFCAMSFNVNVENMLTYMMDPSKMAAAIKEYHEHRTGFLTSTGAEVIAFQKLVSTPGVQLSERALKDLSWLPDDFPDVQFWSMATWVGDILGSPPPDDRGYSSIVAGLLAPLSTGYVTLRSADMADKPIIDPNWLSHPTDKELAVAVMRQMRKLVNTKALREISPSGEAWPGPHIETDEELLAMIQKQAGSFSHPSRTCKMGIASDPEAVVDSRARVIGVENLRVVDLSAIPFLPPGQPQATVYMMAEKIADDILHPKET